MPNNLLNAEQMAELDKLLEEDAANPAPPDEDTEFEEAEDIDEVDTINENVDDLSEGDGEAEDEEAEPDPAAGMNPQAPAVPLPEGIADINQLVEKYNELLTRETQRGDEMQTLRDLNSQLVSIAEALGYTKDIGSVDLNVDEELAKTDPKAYIQQQTRREIADQLKPMLEAQQRILRQKMIDQSWKNYAGQHGDLSDMMDDIKAIMDENPELYDDEGGMQAAHHIARSRRYKPEKELMEDAEFISRAAQNEKIKEKVIAEYLKEVARGGETAPATVGGGGRAAAIGRKKISSLEEASKGLKKMLGL